MFSPVSRPDEMNSQLPSDPMPKPPLQFVAVRLAVMDGDRHVATAVSGTMAKRIARALNLHAPDERGV
jgi:hypothetical protein